MHRDRLGEHGHSRSPLVGRIGNLNMVGFVSRHHLVTADALEHSVHDRPLRGRESQALFGFMLWKGNDFPQAGIESQFSAGQVDPAPDYPTRFADPLAGSATQPEIHRRLTFA